ncbi:DNA topoisomerase I [Candidatus Thorarchaeota archaeon]|nr:MAG: DNA topoisomerase I [Candidatus Thorarchaeota archaeon]
MSQILIISEKPTAAKRLAKALDEDGDPEEVKKRGGSYFQSHRDGDVLVVAYGLGHLYELKQTEKGWKYPRLEMEWVPKYEVSKKDKKSKHLITLMRNLAAKSDKFVVACDYDIEGSLIGYLILKYACSVEPNTAKRMIFSALTKKDIQRAYENALPNLNFPMIDAGEIRHRIDWLYGINLTRALTLSVKAASGWFKIISTGRVQGPSLAFVAGRDRQIKIFVPEPYWHIDVKASHEGEEFELQYIKKKIETLENATSITNALREKSAEVNEVNRRTYERPPPSPFNLSDLQGEAFRHFGYKPSRTLAIAQALYLDALVSYPRTSSQQIPDSINVKQIITNLGKQRTYSKIVSSLLVAGRVAPQQGKKKDPAHPAIHPTGDQPERKLKAAEKKIYDLIVRRFLASCDRNADKESMRVDFVCGDHRLFTRGSRVLQDGWLRIYKPFIIEKDTFVPNLKKGDVVQIIDVRKEEKRSNPPSRYNPSSLLKKLEKEELGTKATRAGIVDSVKSRGYTLTDRFEMSDLGYAVFETMQDYVPDLLSVEFTRNLETDMDKIQRNDIEKEIVLSKAKRELLRLLEPFQKSEEEIGEKLVRGLRGYWKEKREIGPCPSCGDGTLIIVRSPKSGKRFIGCSNYKEGNCTQTYPLPQKGRIVPLEKECPHCGYQMLKIVSGRRAWETCVNWADCPGRQEDLRKLEKQRGKKGEDEK